MACPATRVVWHLEREIEPSEWHSHCRRTFLQCGMLLFVSNDWLWFDNLFDLILFEPFGIQDIHSIGVD